MLENIGYKNLISNFAFQKVRKNSSKIYCMSWEKMGVAKSNGGLRFRDFVIL
jgi:hypothetical protein